jgi:type II secretory pathway pseudopilin PulG
MMRAQRQRLARDENGTSLVEMMMVCMILGIIFPIVAGFLFSTQTAVVSVSSRSVANGQAEVIAQTLSRQIHAAATPAGKSSPIVSATANKLVFYSSLGNSFGPTELSLYVVPSCGGCNYGNLMEDQTQPTSGPTYSATPTQTVELGSGVVIPTPASPGSDCPAGGSGGIFEYFVSPVTSNGACLPLDYRSYNPPALDSSQLSQVENMAVTITTEDTSRTSGSPTATMSLQVSLANVDYANP